LEFLGKGHGQVFIIFGDLVRDVDHALVEIDPIPNDLLRGFGAASGLIIEKQIGTQMLRHGVEEFTELGRLHEPLPGISLLTRQKELKRFWKRSKTDRKFRRLLLAMPASLVSAPSSAKDQLAACALADFTLRKAGAAGRRDLKRRLKAAGWEF
jgi:hypothetical protein